MWILSVSSVVRQSTDVNTVVCRVDVHKRADITFEHVLNTVCVHVNLVF